MKKASVFFGQALLILVCAAAVLAQQQADTKKNLFQEYMERFGPPGPEHKLLEPLLGTWHAKVSCWMDPGQPPQVSDGTLVRKAIMGGRFIQEDFDGTMMGKPFQGRGTIGFDRAKKKYVTTWLDSVSTAINMSYGTYNDSLQTWTFTHEDDCPITGKHIKMRDTLRIVNANEERMEMFRQMGNEKEVKVMEIILTRNK